MSDDRCLSQFEAHSTTSLNALHAVLPQGHSMQLGEMRLKMLPLRFTLKNLGFAVILLILLILGWRFISHRTNVLYIDQESYQKYDPFSQKCGSACSILLTPRYQISIIADMDKASKTGAYSWKSVLRTGELMRAVDGTYSVRWSGDVQTS